MSHTSLVRVRTILRELSISRSSFYALVKSGKFPPPISIGERSVAWLNSDLSDFIAARVQASRPQVTKVAV